MVLRVDVTDAVILVNFWVTLFLPAAGGLFWRWWRSPVGVAFFSMDILIAATFSFTAISLMAGVALTAAAYQWTAIGVFALISPNAVWRLWQLWKIQRGDMPAHDHEPIG